MRFSLSIFILLFLSSCGNTPAESPDKTDSVEEGKTVDSMGYSLMISAAAEIRLPAMIESGEMQKLPGLKMDSQRGYDLLPGDFEPQSYNSVHCIGRSAINDKTDALFFCLKSPGEYEDATETVDIMMVLYDKTGTPLDVCMIASSAIGYCYSYVRTDSLFTVEVDEMEKINVSTYAVEIRNNGFMPEGAETKTFEPTAEGKKAADLYREKFISSHKQ